MALTEEWERKRTIYLLSGDHMHLDGLKRMLAESSQIGGVHSFQKGEAALRFLKAGHMPDALVIGCFLKDMHSLSFLEKLEQFDCAKSMVVVAVGSPRYLQFISRTDLSNTVDYYMMEPYEPQDLMQCVTSSKTSARLPQITCWDREIWDLLNRLDCPKRSTGAQYLASGLQIWLRELSQGRMPQAKSILMELSKLYQISHKGAESGIYRVLIQMKEKGTITAEQAKMREFFEWAVEQIQVRSN